MVILGKFVLFYGLLVVLLMVEVMGLDCDLVLVVMMGVCYYVD